MSSQQRLHAPRSWASGPHSRSSKAARSAGGRSTAARKIRWTCSGSLAILRPSGLHMGRHDLMRRLREKLSKKRKELLAEGLVQPGAGICPFLTSLVDSHAKDLSNLFMTQASEVAQFDRPGSQGIFFGKAGRALHPGPGCPGRVPAVPGPACRLAGDHLRAEGVSCGEQTRPGSGASLPPPQRRNGRDWRTVFLPWVQPGGDTPHGRGRWAPVCVLASPGTTAALQAVAVPHRRVATVRRRLCRRARERTGCASRRA